MNKKYLGLTLGIYGDIIGRPYESAIFHVLKRKKELGDAFVPMIQALRKTFIFEDIEKEWRAISGNNQIWDEVHKKVNSKAWKFSDDTVLTMATLAAIKENPKDPSFAKHYHSFGQKYQGLGFGPGFRKWVLEENPGPAYGATTNGSAMRVGPIGYMDLNLNEMVRLAELSASVTHNSEEAVWGAVQVVKAIYKTRVEGWSPGSIANNILINEFKINDRSCLIETPHDTFDYQCRETIKSVANVLHCSDNAIDLIHNCIRIGGDVDTIAMIAGTIFGAYDLGLIPDIVTKKVEQELSEEMLLLLEN